MVVRLDKIHREGLRAEVGAHKANDDEHEVAKATDLTDYIKDLLGWHHVDLLLAVEPEVHHEFQLRGTFWLVCDYNSIERVRRKFIFLEIELSGVDDVTLRLLPEHQGLQDVGVEADHVFP